MSQTTVIIAIRNSEQRLRMTSVLRNLPDFRIVMSTSDLMSTYTEVESRTPEAVLIDNVLANQPEFEVMRALFSALDVRWLIINGTNSPEASSSTAHPSGADLFALQADASAEILASQLRSLTRKSLSPSQVAVKGSSSLMSPKQKPEGFILIGASTGGVDALLKVLEHWHVNCPPTIIIQHTSEGFGVSLANLLDHRCSAHVKLITGPVQAIPGDVLIGAGTKKHIVFSERRKNVVEPVDGPPVCGHKPSIDALFRSALPTASSMRAAILTGMGRDGAEGLLALRRAGARTVAQDSETSVVFGMPRVAAELNAAEKILPIERVGPALLSAPLRKVSSHGWARA